MALLTCPACGSTASESDLTCPACQAALPTGAIGPGMVVAADPVDSESAPTIDGAADIEHEHGEASATTLLQSNRSLEESSAHAGAPTDAGDSTPTGREHTGGSQFAPSAHGVGISSRGRRPAALIWRFRVLIAAAVLCVSLAVLLQVRPGQRMKPVIAKQPPPTATATATPSPSPTAASMAGYTWYIDSKAGYMVQYPTSWTKAVDASLGVEFMDSSLSNSSTYQLDVYHPDPNTSGVPTQGDANIIAAAWVDYELSYLQQIAIANSETFQRVPGPIPAATIGGQSWQSGIATVDLVDNGQSVPIRLQVYATVHNGRPYIVNVYAPPQVFATGEQQYFTPVLNSFQFLPTSAQGS